MADLEISLLLIITFPISRGKEYAKSQCTPEHFARGSSGVDRLSMVTKEPRIWILDSTKHLSNGEDDS